MNIQIHWPLLDVLYMYGYLIYKQMHGALF